MTGQASVAYRVLTQSEADELILTGAFRGASVDRTDGFIHLSTAEQVAGTLEAHFHGHRDLHVATVDLAKLGDAVRWEESRGGQMFPHIYGPLPRSAVIEIRALEQNEAGNVFFS